MSNHVFVPVRYWKIPPCPSCGAASGKPCMTASGYITKTHQPRMRLARALVRSEAS